MSDRATYEISPCPHLNCRYQSRIQGRQLLRTAALQRSPVFCGCAISLHRIQ
jgi:hypothetical protein